MSADPPDRVSKEFEYSQLLSTYHVYFELIAKGISIYLLIMGACLTLPNAVGNNSASVESFRDDARVFATTISAIAILLYLWAASVFRSLDRRAAALARDLEMERPLTWMLPVVVWFVCGAAVILMWTVSKALA